MNTVALLQPSRVVIGNGCSSDCAGLFAQWNVRRVLLVTSPSLLPELESLKNVFNCNDVKLIEAPLVKSEPTCALMDQVLQATRSESVEGVLGIGGGSPMDVAKLAAALLPSKQRVQEVLGINLLQGRKLPLICVPTTAGTGSEVSPNAILLDESDHLKKGAVSPHLVPDAAFIDPLLTVSVPPAVTAATGIDALTHCIEAYTNTFAHPAVDIYALQGIRLISANLLRAVQNGADAEARANLALGSYFGGLCLGPVNTAAVHALSYPLGGQFHVAHGVSNAVLLPHVMRFNFSNAPERYAEVALALGVERDGSALISAERGVEHISRLSRACGVPQRLSDLGIPRAAIPAMAEAAMKVTRLLKNNPRPVTYEDAIQIYEASY
jgi:alcohol dehydrogenase class IV